MAITLFLETPFEVNTTVSLLNPQKRIAISARNSLRSMGKGRTEINGIKKL